MRGAWLVGGLVAGASLASGCVDTRPSSGRCTGTVDGVSVAWEMDPDASDFHRWDGILGDDDGPFRMSFGGRFLVDAELESMPTNLYLGAHPIPDDAIFHFFRTDVRDAAETTGDGTFNLTTSSWERVGGDMTLRLNSGGSLSCTFDLRHNYALDDGID